MAKTALVVIDLQEDFLPADGSLAVNEGRDIIKPICDLLDTDKFKWTTVIATQDWHPHDHISFASQHGVEPFTQLQFKHPFGEKDEDGKVKTMEQCVWPDHCVQHSHGAEIDPTFLAEFEKLDTVPKSIVKKGYLQDREYYSCFSDCWKIHKTEIEDTLRKLDVTDVVFTGLAYDVCVMNSAIDCAASGFKTYVLKSMCRGVFPEKGVETDKKFTDGGVIILDDAKDLVFF